MDVLGCSSLVFFQVFLYDVDSSLDGHRCKGCLNIIGHDAFIWFQLDALYVLYKVLGILDMVWGSSYQGFQDPGKFLGCFIGYRPYAGNDGS